MAHYYKVARSKTGTMVAGSPSLRRIKIRRRNKIKKAQRLGLTYKQAAKRYKIYKVR